MNYFAHGPNQPFHLSVGAVILNDHGQVLCHYYPTIDRFGVTAKDFYILMRETVEPNEPLETAVKRGCLEEMGAEVEIINYLGPIESEFKEDGQNYRKTTLYFECDLISLDAARRNPNDPESDSQVVWRNPSNLIPVMRYQGKRLGRSDVDESEVLKRLKG